MSESRAIFGLPLLTKDMIEQSARRRTYVLRVVYAAILYGAALAYYGDLSGGGAQSSISNLGRGREMFSLLMAAQVLAVIVLLPAMCCGAITAEKERDTLGLLLLTQLSPRTIVLEKLFSRLVAMGTFQLLSLPLFAVVYGCGGVEIDEINAAIVLLTCWSFVIGAWSVYCSTWHRTTAGAFLAAYSLMPLLACLFGLLIPAGVAHRDWLFLAAVRCTFMLILGVGAIAAAAQQLLERAFVPPRNLLLEAFKKLDAFFEDLNEKTTRGVLLVHERDPGPMFEPIAWRETRKKSLGTVRYLFRFLVLLEVPLVMTISWTIVDVQAHAFNGPTLFFLSVLWPIAVVAVIVHTTNVIASERSRQTFDVLLVAPLTSHELISQKLSGVRRLIGVLSVPFSTLMFFQAIWSLYVVHGLELFRGSSQEAGVLLHEVMGMLFAMIVYPRIIQWIAFHLTMRLKNQTQAILFSLAIVICICGVPFLVEKSLLYFEQLSVTDSRYQWITWLSPIRVLFHRGFAESAGAALGRLVDTSSSDSRFFGFGMHAAIFVTTWLTLRHRALRCFSDLIGRTEPQRGAN